MIDRSGTFSNLKYRFWFLQLKSSTKCRLASYRWLMSGNDSININNQVYQYSRELLLMLILFTNSLQQQIGHQMNPDNGFYKQVIADLFDRLEYEHSSGNLYIPDQQIYTIKQMLLTKLESHNKSLLSLLQREENLLKVQKRDEPPLIKSVKPKSEKREKLKLSKQKPRTDKFDDELFVEDQKPIEKESDSNTQGISEQHIEESLLELKEEMDKEDRIKQQVFEVALENRYYLVTGCFNSTKFRHDSKTQTLRASIDHVFLKTRQGEKFYRNLECKFSTKRNNLEEVKKRYLQQ